MALINCYECDKQVSDTAVSCPNCGAPVSAESKIFNTPITTNQETSKNLKKHQLMSSGLLVFGFMWSYIASSGYYASTGSMAFGALIALIGITWFMITLARIWWHHK